MEVKFSKYEGLGNDFILIDDRKNEIKKITSYKDLAQKLCDRNFGIGGDGVILVTNSENYDIGFRIINSDGSEPEMCGNGIRCFAKFIRENGILNLEDIGIETLAGEIRVRISQRGLVKVDMGEPILDHSKIPYIGKTTTLKIAGKDLEIFPVSMGNPHAVIFVDNLDNYDIKGIGSEIENLPLFPEKTNVEFIQIINKENMKMRVWERGVGETLACGTGACASLVAANLKGYSNESSNIELLGGILNIYWDKKTNHIFKEGPARLIFKGVVLLS